MSDNPPVSVIIPSYNRSTTVCESVESALRQSYSPLEVIVVDDGSTDDTEQKLAPYAGRIMYIRQRNQGAASARNRGIEVAQGIFVAFLDADDLWRQEKTATQAEYLKSHPEVGVVCSDAREFDGQRTVSESFLRQFGSIACEGLVFESIARTAFPLTSTVMVRRNCLGSLRFDESLRNFQDIDFFMRLNLQHAIGVIRRPLVDRRLHAGNASRNQYNRFLCRTVAFRKILNDGTPLSQNQRKTVKELLALSCAKVADCHWGDYELKEARAWYLKASRFDMAGLNAFAHALLTFLPRGAVGSLRQFREALDSKIHLMKSYSG